MPCTRRLVAPVMLILMVTVLLRTSLSIPPNWSNMMPSFAATSSSYEAHLAIATGAVGASGAAALKSAAVPIIASHSLRVMLLLQQDAGADRYLVQVHAPPLIGLVNFQSLLPAIGRHPSHVLVITQVMQRHVFDWVILIIYQVHAGRLSVF